MVQAAALPPHIVHSTACLCGAGTRNSCANMPARSAAALLAALVLGAAAVSAQQDCPSSCYLSQCPCYSPQVDDVNYARPPGCVAQVPPPRSATDNPSV